MCTVSGAPNPILQLNNTRVLAPANNRYSSIKRSSLAYKRAIALLASIP